MMRVFWHVLLSRGSGEHMRGGVVVRIGTKVFLWILLFFVVGFLGLGIFRVSCLTYVEEYEFGYVIENNSGEMYPTEHKGYVFSWPFLQSVYTIDLRPTQTCLFANNLVVECKTVAFNPEGWREFVRMYERKHYRVYDAFEKEKLHGDLTEVLTYHAFSSEVNHCSFLTVLPDVVRQNPELGGSQAPTDLFR